MDALKVKQWDELIALQQEQIRLLASLCAARGVPAPELISCKDYNKNTSS